LRGRAALRSAVRRALGTRFAIVTRMEIESHPTPTAPTADSVSLYSLLDRLLYTTGEPERELLLAEIKSEIQAIRTLADF
jgi:hypothetical protein